MELYKKRKGDYWTKSHKNSKVYWLQNDNQCVRPRGEWIFSFDKKYIYNFYGDYPKRMTKKEVEFFDKYEPFWSKYFGVSIDDLEFDVGELKKDTKLKEGIDNYKQIMKAFKNTKFDESFTRRFNKFYRIMRRSKEWYKGYYKVFKKYKIKTSNYSIDDILKDLYRIDNNGKHMIDLSFASKMLHTLKPKKYPIYDSMVAKALDLNKVKYSKQNVEKRIKDSVDLYNDLLDMYKKKDVKHLASIFDKAFPREPISDIKKADFLIWWYGKKLVN